MLHTGTAAHVLAIEVNLVQVAVYTVLCSSTMDAHYKVHKIRAQPWILFRKLHTLRQRLLCPLDPTKSIVLPDAHSRGSHPVRCPLNDTLYEGYSKVAIRSHWLTQTPTAADQSPEPVARQLHAPDP